MIPTYPINPITTQMSEAEFCLRVPSDHPLAILIQGWLVGHEAIAYLEPRGYDVAGLKARFGFFPKPNVVGKQLRYLATALKRQRQSAIMLAKDPLISDDPTWHGGLADETDKVKKMISRLQPLLEKFN